MPQNSAVYAVSRIRSRERTLLDRETIKRMSEGTAEEAWRTLTELGYGGANAETEELDSETLCENELKSAYELVKEVTTNPTLTDIFFLRADVSNLKLFIKQRLTGAKDSGIYAFGGVYDPNELKKMVELKNYSALPEKIAAGMNAAEEMCDKGEINPARLSTIIDQGYVDHALEKGDKFIKTYFKAVCDFDNIIAMARMADLNADEERLKALLLTGGDIPHSALIKAFSSRGDGFTKDIAAGEFKEEMKKALTVYAETKSAAAIERARDNALMRLASRGKNDIDTIAPVIGFLLAKRQETRVVRIVMTCLRNKLGAETIAERMRVIYGE